MVKPLVIAGKWVWRNTPPLSMVQDTNGEGTDKTINGLMNERKDDFDRPTGVIVGKK